MITDFDYLKKKSSLIYLGMYEIAYHNATDGSDEKVALANETRFMKLHHKHNWSTYEDIDWNHLDLEECPM